MRDLILLIVFAGFLPLCFWRPHIGLLVWACIGYLNPHRLTWGFAYSFPFVMLAAAATLAGILCLRDRRISFPFTGTTFVWACFVLWTVVTTQFALNPETAAYELDRMIKTQIMILVSLLLMHDKQRIILLAGVIAFSIGFYGIKGGWFTLITGGNFLVWGPPGTFFEGNNEVAFALLICLPLMRFFQMYWTNKWLKRFALLAMILSGFAIVGSYSRGALVGGLGMMGMLWLKSRHKVKLAIPAVLALLVLIAFMPQSWKDRMGTIQTYDEDASAMGRINAWYFAVNLANDRPIVGGGFGTFTIPLFLKYAPVPEDHHDAHSIFFEVLGEQGYIGLLFFMGMGGLAFLTGSSVIRAARGIPELQWASDLAAMAQVGLTGYAVGGLFLGLAYFDLPYHLMAILVLLKSFVAKERVRLAQQASDDDEAPWEAESLSSAATRLAWQGRRA
ncbi:MAG: putative O-glycosylation ligase, exosortase A system-associated [Pseudomonadota bacterium]